MSNSRNSKQKNLSLSPVLVTGSHRSGTTWVGKTIAKSKKVTFFYEPFGKHGDTPIDFFYQHLPPQYDNPKIAEHVESSLLINHSWINDFKRHPSLVRLVGATLRHLTHIGIISGATTPLMKDPHALLSAEWLEHFFNMKVIITIRHPAAFVSSLMRLNWQFNFSNITDQHHQIPLSKELLQSCVELKSKQHDLIDQGILMWRILHYVIDRYKNLHHNWLFIRHEDISTFPLEYFSRIFSYIEIPMSNSIKRWIIDSTSAFNPADTKKVHEIKRNSIENIWNWKTRLTESEQEHIYKGTKDIWPLFYSDSDW